ncbi:MAG: purine phosphorylase, partial [Chitinophagaceae bacterium]
FKHLADLSLDMDFTVSKRWDCPHLPVESILPLAKSNSMNAAMAPFVSSNGIDIENMEGAAFFQVCIAENQRFLQVRSVSNFVRIGDDNWDFVSSIQSLTQALYKMIDYLISHPDDREHSC